MKDFFDVAAKVLEIRLRNVTRYARSPLNKICGIYYDGNDISGKQTKQTPAVRTAGLCIPMCSLRNALSSPRQLA